MLGFLGEGHSPTDRFENLGLSKIRYEKAERVAALRLGADITARAGPPVDETGQLKFAEGPVDGNTRCAKGGDQLRFAWQPLAYLIFS